MNFVFPKKTFSLLITPGLLGFIGDFCLRAVLTEASQTVVAEPAPIRETVTPVSVEKTADLAIGSDLHSIPVIEDPEVAEEETEIDYEQMFARLEAEDLRLVPKKALFYLIRNAIPPDQPILPMIAEALRLSPSEVEEAEAVLKTIGEELAILEMD